ncbi:MAG: oleate hydratase [Peptoniphilus grossensis]|uniref:oleate hydratase n=1 Tax=Peptoniphilus grossensis TaxID=1465756 RepID=UPI00291335B5|nr:oleate hydratase [Peptoniphilus grossensis]MDU7150594.1 oleate hydratase [Peptoniphilus grossensis]
MSRKDDIKKLAIAAATISAAIFAAKKVSDDDVKVLMPNRDENSKAYLLGDGFGNLALAYALINHANLSPLNINIYTKNFNEFIKIKEGENNYKTFDNRFSEFNFKNTYEVLKNILDEDELNKISEKIAKKEKPMLLDLSLNKFSKVLEVDEASKKKLYKLMLYPMELDDKTSLEQYFLFSNFLSSNLFYYLASIYNLKSTSPVLELKEALLDFIGSESYFDLDTDRIYKFLRDYLIELGVNFYDEYKFIDFNAKDNYVDKLTFEKNEQVEEVLTDLKDIISIESPTYLSNLALGNTTNIPEKILSSYISKNNFSAQNIYKEIEGKTRDSSILFVNLEFSDDSFIKKLKKNLQDNDFFIFKVKSGISAKIVGNEVILKILNPNKNSIFVGDAFKALNGEDFFFALIKLFNLEENYADLRFNLKNVSISVFENYKKIPGESYKRNINKICNLFFISSKNSDFGELYSVEKLVQEGIKNAHDIMGIDHLEVFENNLSKMEILKFINNL